MNLTITQDNTRTETINSSIIDKLYEIAFAASSDPNSTVSLTGRLESPKGYKYKIDWLNTEFSPDLTITVPASGLYMVFYDSAVENILKTSIGDGNGVGILSIHDLQDLNSLGFVNNTNITDFREGVLFDNASIATNAGFVNGCTNLDVVGVPPYLTRWSSLITYGCAPHKIVISNWNNWLYPILVANGQGLCYIKHDLCTLNADNTLSVVTNINLPEGVDFPSGHLMFGGFYNSTINTVNIPTTVTRLNSFLYSDILTITFTQGSTLSSIEEYCFYECTSLALNVSNLPQTLTTIGDHAFRSCSNITGVLDLPNLTSLGQYSFYSTGITSIADLGSITSIPNNCFDGCTSLTSATLPSTCTSIGRNSFINTTSLTSINLSNVTFLGDQSFRNTGITGTIDLTSLEEIERGAFYKSKITKIILPASTANGLEYIASNNWQNLHSNGLGDGFKGMTELTEVITNIEDWVYPFRFSACNKLKPFVIYQPLLTNNIPIGILGGGYFIDLHWNNRNQWDSQVYWPNLTSAQNVNLYINGNRDCCGMFCAGEGDMNINLVYMKSITAIDDAAFVHCNTNFVMNNTTVPTLTTHGQNSETRSTVDHFMNGDRGTLNTLNIYVPDSAVSDYQAAWSGHSSKIFGIGSLNNGIIYATESDWTAAGKPVGLIAEYLGLSSADLATFMTANNLTYWTNPNA